MRPGGGHRAAVPDFRKAKTDDEDDERGIYLRRLDGILAILG
jgi:hypothetical protein